MRIDHAVLPFAHELSAQQAHEPGEANQINGRIAQPCIDRFVEIGARGKIAMRNDGKISESEYLILISDDERVPGGKFIEAGIAIGMGKAVVALGKRENVMLFHENVVLCETKEKLYAELTS